MRTSLLIATHNRAEQLARSLKRLSALTVPDEVVVVDDGGTDNTARVCCLEAVRGLPVRYLYNHNPGVSNRCLASNVALRMASFEHVIYADAEHKFTTDIVAQLCAAREQDTTSVLACELAYRQHECRPPDITPGGNVNSYMRSWLEDIGGWDENMPGPTGYDDADLHTRLAYAGHPQVNVRGTRVLHQWHEPHPWNLPDQHIVNPNRIYLEAKRFPRDIVANQGHDWGVLR